jgi:hypothetical protein
MQVLISSLVLKTAGEWQPEQPLSVQNVQTEGQLSQRLVSLLMNKPELQAVHTFGCV